MTISDETRFAPEHILTITSDPVKRTRRLTCSCGGLASTFSDFDLAVLQAKGLPNPIEAAVREHREAVGGLELVKGGGP